VKTVQAFLPLVECLPRDWFIRVMTSSKGMQHMNTTIYQQLSYCDGLNESKQFGEGGNHKQMDMLS
jgi:hypothetical protein